MGAVAAVKVERTLNQGLLDGDELHAVCGTVTVAKASLGSADRMAIVVCSSRRVVSRTICQRGADVHHAD